LRFVLANQAVENISSQPIFLRKLPDASNCAHETTGKLKLSLELHNLKFQLA
jgi:hypothetical protein